MFFGDLSAVNTSETEVNEDLYVKCLERLKSY